MNFPTVYSNPRVSVSHLVYLVHSVRNIHPVLGFVKGIYIYIQAGKIIKMNFPQYLEYKYLEWQQVVGERKTVRQFAEYIGVSASSITMWWKGKRVPEGDNVRRLADKLGIEVYDVLEIPRPDSSRFIFYFTFRLSLHHNPWKIMLHAKRTSLHMEFQPPPPIRDHSRRPCRVFFYQKPLGFSAHHFTSPLTYSSALR